MSLERRSLRFCQMTGPMTDRRLGAGRPEAGDLGRMARPVLYGRDDDIALSRLIDHVHDRGAALLINGEPGSANPCSLAQDLARGRGLRLLQLCGARPKPICPSALCNRPSAACSGNRDALVQQRGPSGRLRPDDDATAWRILVALATLTLLRRARRVGPSCWRPTISMARPAQPDVLRLSPPAGFRSIVLLMAVRTGSRTLSPFERPASAVESDAVAAARWCRAPICHI